MDIIGRSGWGAAAPRGKPVPIPVPVATLFLHHSVTPDEGAQTVRDIQKFHQNTRGWNDIAYTWLYSPKHRVFFEGRGPGVAGAHTRGHNKTSHAVCVLGNYQVNRPPRHAVEDLAQFAAWHGIGYGPLNYVGHKDVGATLCPGQHLYAVLRDINVYAEAPITIPPDSPIPPTLRLGSTGEHVTTLQRALMVHDGIYGRTTEAVVRDYQAANGLTVDGICGPRTWSHILGA
jgi:hypothetical protein